MIRLSHTLHFLRHTAYVFILAICLYWFIDNYTAGYTNWFIMGLGALCTTQLFLRVRWADQLLGWILCLLCLYMLLAVFSDWADYMRGAPYQNPQLYFGVGFSLFSVALLLSVCIILSTYRK